MVYRWEKGFWTRPVRIIQGGNEVGRLVYDSGFTSRATGEIDGEVFRFQTKGLWKSAIIITDEDGRSHEVALGTWRSTGRIAGGLQWSTNVWNSKWRWTNDAGTPVVSSVTDNLRGTKGTIAVADDTPTDPRMLMLTGVYVHTYFMQAATLLIVILVVLWT